jgi:peptidoglycan hydrolase-like protein with peptidoglycan-binding domain
MKKTIAVIAFLTVPALAASAQAGLNKIQFLALQQELRDQGCGVTNVDGRYGPSTRRAIATCAKKFNTANNAAALLTAMNIGFGPNDNPPAPPSGGGGGGGVSAAAASEGESVKTEKKEVKRATKKKKAAKAAADTTKQ